MLGWPPDQVLTTPIPWLQLAIDGRMEWEMRRNGQDPEESRSHQRQSAPDPEKVQQQIKAAFDPLARRNERKRGSREEHK